MIARPTPSGARSQPRRREALPPSHSSEYIALLRAINVAGRTVAMADLRDLLTQLGFENVRSFLQSGNLVFDAPHPPLRGTLRLPLASLGVAQGRLLSPLRGARDVDNRGPSPRLRGEGARRADEGQIERLLEAESAKRLGLETDFFVRTAAEWDVIVDANPFRKEAKEDPGRLVVLFLKDAGDGATLQKAIKGRETARGKGRQLYVFYPDGQGRSKLTNALIEKTLGTRATARNWNTVLKLKHVDHR